MNKKGFSPKLVRMLVVVVAILYLAPITAAGISAVPYGHNIYRAQQGDYVQDRILVRFAPDATGKQRNAAEKHQILSSVNGASIKKEFTAAPGLRCQV